MMFPRNRGLYSELCLLSLLTALVLVTLNTLQLGVLHNRCRTQTAVIVAQGDSRLPLEVNGTSVRYQGALTPSIATRGTHLAGLKSAIAAVDEMIDTLLNENSIFPENFSSTSLRMLTRTLGYEKRTAAEQLKAFQSNDKKKAWERTWERRDICSSDSVLTTWKLFHHHIRRFSLYDPDDPTIDRLLHEMATERIVSIDEAPGGTQLHMKFVFAGGATGFFKPMRYPREVEANENRYIFDDMERHVSEIASFHLDKLLGFYRVPPTTGRVVNLTSEIKPLAPENIRDTFFISPADNICFYGDCEYYCDSAHAFCGHPDLIEGSIMSYFPSQKEADTRSKKQPYRRSYNEDEKADWEMDETFCESIHKWPRFRREKMQLDLIDVHIFDFLTGNKDRHSIDTFREWGDATFPILYDNGRGFGRQTYDAMSILAPLRQCCKIRKSTFLKLVKLHKGAEKLSALMEDSLKTDPVAPVLLPGHLHALDRRLIKVLKTVADCHIFKNNSYDQIIRTDPY